MQPNRQSNYARIAKKELQIFFSSPAALIFLAIFLTVNLFIFFWVEAFFSRNIADVRPLFEWMPILLIFLVAALTMRMWSEERRMGTLEFVMTVPVSTTEFVVGKFIACLCLIVVALALTLAVPFTVASLGMLDWGPVIGAYVATLFLGAAYSSIGLFVSARSDSQIVSLMMTVVVCFVFYLLGADVLTNLLGTQGGEFLKLLGTGSRFESITRGVIDIRDIYYYLSIMGIFLTLNIFALEKMRWSEKEHKPHHGLWRNLVFLSIANFLLANFWLAQVQKVRIDLTQGKIYTISDATHSYINRLQEPLLLRGYFSAKTHPLLAPLVPQVQDLLREYEIAGNGKVRTELVDPALEPELEDEANNKYGIKPTPFQVADKYQAALVNSYFNVLVQYGDQHHVLGFQDLIEVKQEGETDLDVRLRNPEYDITSAIKKVLTGYQSAGDLFATIDTPIQFVAYVSKPEALPEPLRDFTKKLETTLGEFQKEAGEKFQFQFVEPEANGGRVAQELMDNYGMRPMTTSLFSNESFYFYLTVLADNQIIQIPLPENLSEEQFQKNLESSIKRFSSGFTKTVSLALPPAESQGGRFSQPFQGDQSFSFLEDVLGSELTIRRENFDQGRVAPETDLLVVLSPKSVDNNQLFAIDQFLMKGGTVIVATSPYATSMTQSTLFAKEHESGMTDWLKHMGVGFEQGIVLDEQNTPFPIPVQRQVGGFTFSEIQMLDYPYFVDVRGDGIAKGADVMAGIPQVTINWASPLVITPPEGVNAQPLLSSSPESWLSDDLNILPDLSQNIPQYPAQENPQSYVLAAALNGRFQSWFKDKDSPVFTAEQDTPPSESDTEASTEPEEGLGALNSVINHSTESARLIVIGSNEFITDQTLQLVSTSSRSIYRNSLQLMQNLADWSLEDAALLSIRSRSHFSRTIPNIERSKQQMWEWINYSFVLLSLIGLWFGNRLYRSKMLTIYQNAIR